MKINKLNKKIYFKIIDKMGENGKTQLEMANLMETSPSSLNQSLKKLSEGKSVLTETVFKIADCLGVDIKELF